MVRAVRVAALIGAVLAWAVAPNAVLAAECGKGEWIRLPDMSVPRSYPGLAALPDGNVLVLGGGSAFWQDKYDGTWDATASTEVFDFKNWTWLPGPDLNQPTGDMDTVWLNDGRLLITGGVPMFRTSLGSCDPKPFADVSDTLFYIPVASSIVFGPSIPKGGTAMATLSALPDGRALFFGLVKAFFDPVENSWTPFDVNVPGLTLVGEGHTATTLQDGRILIAGGRGDGVFWNETLIYNPKSNSWKLGPKMILGRELHAAALLANGDVMMIHGNYADANVKRSYVTDIYEVAKNRFVAGPATKYGWYKPIAVTLKDGRVMIVGGEIDEFWCNEHPYTEIYDPCTRKWTDGPHENVTHFEASAIVLPDGRVFLAGGKDNPVAEIYDPNAGCNTDGGEGTGLEDSGQVCIAPDEGSDAAGDAGGDSGDGRETAKNAPGCGCVLMTVE